MGRGIVLVTSGRRLDCLYSHFMRHSGWSGRSMGRCDRGDHRRRGDWSCSGRVNWRSCGSGRRRLNRRNHSGESSCALWSAAAGWLSIRALGRDARFLLQSLHGTRLRPSRSSTRWTYARRRYWPAFPQTVIDCQRSDQRACAWSASTSARASSVIFNNSGHGR